MPDDRLRESRLRFGEEEQAKPAVKKPGRKLTREQAGTVNMAAFLRKMAIDGYVLRLHLPELKELVSLLRRCSNNLNQVAKRANETDRIYTEDLEDLAERLDRLWESAKEIMTALAKIN